MLDGFNTIITLEVALFYLDQQVSNSGRLRALLLDKAAVRSVQIRVELHPSDAIIKIINRDLER